MTSILDRHTLTAVLADAGELQVISGTVEMNESRSPYVTGDLTVTMPTADVLSALDPRDGARVQITLRRDFGTAWRVADFAGGIPAPFTLTELGTRYSGMNLRGIAGELYVPWNAFGLRVDPPREFNLVIRARTIDHVAQTVTLALTSDEALLIGHALVDTDKYFNPSATTVRALVQFVLDRIGATLEPGDDDAAVAAEATEWLPGTPAWDYLTPTIEQAGLRLWSDGRGNWYLTERDPLAPGQLTLSTGEAGTLTAARDVIDQDGDAYDGIVIAYQWTDDAGLQHVQWDAAGETDALRVRSITRNQPYPGAGAAQQMLNRAKGRGRRLDLTAVSDYRAVPGQAFSATLPSTDIQTGVVSAVLWRFPGGEMDVETRGLLDTPETAWVFDDAGVGWDDIPVGVDWMEDA